MPGRVPAARLSQSVADVALLARLLSSGRRATEIQSELSAAGWADERVRRAIWTLGRMWVSRARWRPVRHRGVG